jgi:hypothetical protein
VEDAFPRGRRGNARPRRPPSPATAAWAALVGFQGTDLMLALVHAQAVVQSPSVTVDQIRAAMMLTLEIAAGRSVVAVQGQ